MSNARLPAAIPERRFSTKRELVTLEPTYSLGNINVPEIKELMYESTEEEMSRSLQQKLVLSQVSGNPLDVSTKIRKLSRSHEAFFPLTEFVHLALALLTAIQNLMRARMFGNNEFLRFFFATAQLRKNAALLPLPTCIQEMAGGLFALVGASGSGKSAFIRRFTSFLPKPFFLRDAPNPSLEGMWVFPVMHLEVRVTDGVRDVAASMRQQIIAVTGTLGMESKPLPDMLSMKPENAAITACIAVNVGLVIVDGLGIRNSNSETAAILSFLLKLRREGGIPVFISCTPAFQQSIEHLQSEYRCLFSGQTTYLESFDAPAESASADDDACGDFIDCYWRSAVMLREIPQPVGIKPMLHTATVGSPGLLTVALSGMDSALATLGEVDHSKMGLMHWEQLATDALRPFKGAIAAIRIAEKEAPVIHENIAHYVDYLPESVASTPRVRQWLIPQVKRGRRAAS